MGFFFLTLLSSVSQVTLLALTGFMSLKSVITEPLCFRMVQGGRDVQES